MENATPRILLPGNVVCLQNQPHGFCVLYVKKVGFLQVGNEGFVSHFIPLKKKEEIGGSGLALWELEWIGDRLPLSC